MWKLSIDIAERNGALLRRLLRSAERLSERAIARGLRLVNTRRSRSSALLVRMTRADQRLGCCPISAAQQSLCLDGSSGALLRPQRGADCGDQFLGVDRLVDAVDEAGGHQALALDLRERGERDRRGVAVVAAGELDRARAAQRLEAVLPGHGEVDEEHVRPARPQRPLQRGAETAAGVED